jgi:hypothetical protein
MLKAKDLPVTFWGEAVMTAVYILNRSSTKGASGRTPYELWTGNTPSVHHLRTFGSVAHVKDRRPHLRKLDDRSKPMIFVGYEAGSMAYRAYDPATRRLHITHDVVFDEDAKWSWENDKINSEFIVEYVQAGQPEVVITHHEEQAVSPGLRADAAASPVPGGGGITRCCTSHTGPVVVHTLPLADAWMQLDVNHDDEAPLWFRTLRNIDDAGPTFGLA